MCLLSLCNHILMNNAEDALHQPQPVQQQPKSSVPLGDFKSLKPLAMLIAVILTAVIAGIGGYRLGIKTSQILPQAEIISHLSPTIVHSSPITPANSAQATTTVNWNTYTDVENGFEIKYPANWSQLILSDKRRVNFTPDIPEPLGEIYNGFPGAVVYASQIENCTNSSDYIKRKIMPLKSEYPEITIKPLNLPNMEGFIVEGLPGQAGVRGPTAFIFQCPRLIQIGFDLTGEENGEKIFNHMLSTLKVWRLK